MGIELTIGVLVAALLIFGWATWQARKPTELGQVPIIPYLPLQFITILVALMMAAHLISIISGVPFTGRGR